MRKVTLTKQEENTLERGVQMLSSDPAIPISNQLWINKTQRRIKCFDNSEVLTLSQMVINSTVILSAQNITDKYVTLSAIPQNPSQVVLIPEGGPPQVYGIDFTIIDNIKISWSGLGLDGFLETGERLFISYAN